MAEVFIDIQSLGEVVARFNIMDRKIRERAAASLSRSGKLLKDAMVSGVRGDSTGKLKGSIRTTTLNDGLSVFVRSTASEWVYTEFGMGALGAKTYPYQTPWWFKRKGMTKLPAVWHTGTAGSSRSKGQGLFDWAISHGYRDPIQVAKAIFKRGGIRARPFVQPAIEANIEYVNKDLVNAIYDGVEASFAGMK
jgi:hypothetical protein